MSESAEGEPSSYDSFGENGRRELEHARHDPRLARGRAAAIADYWDAMEEVERVRTQAILGAHALRDLAAKSRLRRGQSGVGSGQPGVQRDRQRLPALNAQTLVTMNSALDSMVEEFAPPCGISSSKLQWSKP